MTDTETYVQERDGCPMCGAYDSTWVGRSGDLHWVRCRDCGVDYVLEDVDLPPEEIEELEWNRRHRAL